MGLNGLGLNGLAINGLGINGLGLGINGLGVRTVGINNLGLINGASLAYNAVPMAAPVPVAMPMAAPIPVPAPVPIAAPMVTSSQYHAQTELGEASHGYSYPGQAASHMRDAMGNQIGSWAYINPEGKEVKVSYVADSLGFRVLSNDLPVAPVALPVPDVLLPVAPIDMGVAPLPVMDTPEVVEAKIAHMAAMDAAKSGIVPVMDLPVPVEDTEEVKAAKAEHAEAKAKIVEESKDEEVKEEAKDRKKRQVLGGLWGRGLGLVGSPIVRSDVAISAPMTRDAVLTQIVHNPGHAMSYRVD